MEYHVRSARLTDVDTALRIMLRDSSDPGEQRDGAGDGILYLGIPQDISGANDSPSFSAWAVHKFGLTAQLPGDLGETDVVFSMCEAEVTLLGEEFGASIATWAESFSSTGCSVGGSSSS